MVPYKNLLAFVEGNGEATVDANKTDDQSIDEDEKYRLTRNATYNVELERAKIAISRKVNKRCRELKVCFKNQMKNRLATVWNSRSSSRVASNVNQLPDNWPAEQVLLLNALKQRDFNLTGNLPAKAVIDILTNPVGKRLL